MAGAVKKFREKKRKKEKKREEKRRKKNFQKKQWRPATSKLKLREHPSINSSTSMKLEAARRRAGAVARHLVVKDERTGKTATLKVSEGNTFKASDLKPLGVRTYDPGYTNTAAVKSSISYIDGAKGILRYRGYPIEELADGASYLDVAHLVLYGELPNQRQSNQTP